jgi:hypothetical protein
MMAKMSDDKPIEDLTAEEIGEALTTTLQEPANSLEESAEELKAMGVRDINDIDVSAAMAEAMKNVQIQKTLADITRGSEDKKSPKDYLEHHIKFLARISEGKDEKGIAESLTLEHAKAVLKTTAKMELPDEVIKKHLKTLKKKYR